MSMNPMIEIIENEDGSITTREPATADLYLFGTIRIPEKVARIIAFIGAIFIVFLLINSCIELHKKFTQPDPFVSGPGALSSSEKYIAFDGLAQRTYQPSKGDITYCDPDDQYNAQCPLYYAVTANYEADELIPRSLTVDIESCDQSLSKRMTIYNVETTYDINYHTGETRR